MIGSLVSAIVALDIGSLIGAGGMPADLIFGLKIVAVVMLYGYMHMNLGGGVLSTAVFVIFAFYFIFYANGVLAIFVLVLFFIMIHGFDMLWGGDIVKGNIQGMRQHTAGQRDAAMQYQMGVRMGR